MVLRKKPGQANNTIIRLLRLASESTDRTELQKEPVPGFPMNFHSFVALDNFSKPEDFPPVFVIWGEQNKILPLKTGEAFCQQSSPDRIEVIPDCGHLVMREKPEAVNKMMKAFLDNA